MKPNLNDLAKSRKARRKMRRLQGFSLGQIIPHCITLASASIALTGVQFALSERFYLAVLAILVAGILDGLDGRMARFLNVESDFGSQLDSLADFVASGVSPGLILYFWGLN
ncbi:MAG: CDP-alcohol phosphatidyltransferase family protein, partial [Pseudomonadota bacterium]